MQIDRVSIPIGGKSRGQRVRRWASLVVGLSLALLPVAATAIVAPLKDDDAAADKLLLHQTGNDDTLLDVARHYDVGYTELLAANPGVDPWLPGKDRYIRIPKYYVMPDVRRQGMVINLAQQRLYYFHEAGSVDTFPIGIGETGHDTPLGKTKIVKKAVDPVWIPTVSIRKRDPTLPARVPPGPDNPLGGFALRLGWPEYLIHGTNVPDSVGRDLSNGCIRLYPEDIEHLFAIVPIGTPVHIVRQEVVGAWVDGRLVIEVFPSQAQAAEIGLNGKFTPAPPKDLIARVKAMAKGRDATIDWEAVKRAGDERTGLPMWVGEMRVPQIAASPPP